MKPKSRVLWISVFALTAISLQTEANYWTQKANVGSAGRADAAGCAIAGKGYIGTGYVTGYTKDWWEYDPLTNTWTQKADFAGSPTVESICIAIAGKAYFLPFATNDFYCYDPSANTWSLKASFPGQTRQGAIGFAIDTKGYFGLGATPILNPQLDDLWEYDALLDTWSQKASLPALPRVHAAAFAIASKGFVGMGLNSTTYLSDFWMYDPVLNTWTQKSSFPGGARYEGTGFELGGYGYMGGGYGMVPQSTFWRYNPLADYWSPIASLPSGGRVETVCFSIGNYGFLGTGWDGINFLNDFWQYSPDSILSSGVGLNHLSVDVTLFPNPASDYFSVYCPDFAGSYRVSVFDAEGNSVYVDNGYVSGKKINVSTLAPGCYYVETGQGLKRTVLKIIII